MSDGGRVLVSGGSGFLATNLSGLLGRAGLRIVRLGRPGAVFPPVPGGGRAEDRVGDIRDRSTWEAALAGVDTVFHLAAQTSVAVAESDPGADLEANVRPMLGLIEACRARGAGRVGIVFAGTVTEAGIPDRLPLGEGGPDRPVTIYDLHKLMAESYLECQARLGVVRGTTLRLANVYGPGPRSGSPDRGILNQMVSKALGGEPLTIYGKGEFVRDYVYVEDVCRAFLAARASLDRLNGKHFVIGSGEGHTIAEAVDLVAARVAARTGRRVQVVHSDPPRPQSPIEARNFVADTSRFSEAAGWKASVRLAEGIDRTIEAVLSGEAGSA